MVSQGQVPFDYQAMEAYGRVGIEGFVEGVVGDKGIQEGDLGVRKPRWSVGGGSCEGLAVPIGPCTDVGFGKLDVEDSWRGMGEDLPCFWIVLGKMGKGFVGDGEEKPEVEEQGSFA